ncbi:MAG: cytochrome c [Calditrichaeota bacterium]|nr:cytochrome c [Calditrichota bacterium]
MKRTMLMLWPILLLVLAFACQKADKKSMKKKGTAVAAADSTALADPWKIYTYDERRGKQLYDHYCIICHGENGEGDGFNSYTLDPRPKSLTDSAYVSALSDATLEQIIAFGGRGVNRSVLMPSYQNTLNRDQITYIVKYIRTFLKTNK